MTLTVGLSAPLEIWDSTKLNGAADTREGRDAIQDQN